MSRRVWPRRTGSSPFWVVRSVAKGPHPHQGSPHNLEKNSKPEKSLYKFCQQALDTTCVLGPQRFVAKQN